MNSFFSKKKDEWKKAGSANPPQDVLIPDPITVVTAAGNRLVPFYDLSDTPSVVNRIVDLLQGSTALANKYLYLGPHGACCWGTVESSGSFSVKARARELLHKQLSAVLERCVPRESKENLDVVSLGTGTGHDDVYILRELWERSETPVSLFAIDLSNDLLRMAMREIKRSVVLHPEREKVTSLEAFCIDIESLFVLREYFFERRTNQRRLYHLLGLTLGNNNESMLLGSIAAGMTEGDLLLLAVDFCLDRPEWRSESILSYSNTEWEINDFLTCPLKTAVAVQREQRMGLGFGGVFVTPHGDRCDFLKDRFRIIKHPMERADEIEPRLSDVPGSLSLARYYVPQGLIQEFDATDYNKSMRGKLCDFSNKYRSNEFEAWIEQEGRKRGLVLLNESIHEWNEGSQHLILLQKTRSPVAPRIEAFLSMTHKDLDNIFGEFIDRDRTLAKRAEGLLQHFEVTEANVGRLRDTVASALERKPKGAVGSDVTRAIAYLNWAESLCAGDE